MMRWGLLLVAHCGGSLAAGPGPSGAGLQWVWWGSLAAISKVYGSGSVVVTHGLSCSAASGTFPPRRLSPCLPHGQADSSPLRPHGSSVRGHSTRGQCLCDQRAYALTPDCSGLSVTLALSSPERKASSLSFLCLSFSKEDNNGIYLERL